MEEVKFGRIEYCVYIVCLIFGKCNVIKKINY